MLIALRPAGLGCAVLALSLAASGPGRADAPYPPSGDETMTTPLADAPPAEGEDEPLDSSEQASVPPDGTAAAEDAPVVLDGPLRPKGQLPPRDVPPQGRDEWRRSYEGGVKWKKGDMSVTVSGAPFSSFRIGAGISR